MLNTVEAYLGLRRAAGFEMKTAECLLKSLLALRLDARKRMFTRKRRSTGRLSAHLWHSVTRG
jgi:hypothetical protein